MAKGSGNTRTVSSNNASKTRTVINVPNKRPPLTRMRNMQSIHNVMQAYGTIANVPGDAKAFAKNLWDAIARSYSTQKDVFYKRYSLRTQEAEKTGDTKLNDKENKLFDKRLKKLGIERDKLEEEYEKFIKAKK